MPPKKEPASELADASEEKEMVEKELVISYLKSKLGRCPLTALGLQQSTCHCGPCSQGV